MFQNVINEFWNVVSHSKEKLQKNNKEKIDKYGKTSECLKDTLLIIFIFYLTFRINC